MFCSNLKTVNFRCLGETRTVFSPNLNFFHGKNAQGKTTLLEALRILSTGRSFLTHSGKEMIQFKKNHFFLEGKIVSESGEIEMKYGQDDKGKAIRINGEPIRFLTDFVGLFDTVLFIPDDFELVTSSPEMRRRYLDIQLAQSSKEYLENLKAYNRVLKQRNALLKRQSYNERELNAWSLELVKTGGRIIEMRLNSLRNLNEYSDRYMKQLSQGKESLNIQYRSVIGERGGDFKETFSRILEEQKNTERKLGFTLTGPHRDDLQFILNGHDASKFASRGQLKTIAISLKFSESDNILHYKKKAPVLLIDDIFSEIDEGRQRNIFNFFKTGQQVFMASSIHPSGLPFDKMFPIKMFEVEDGQIKEIT